MSEVLKCLIIFRSLATVPLAPVGTADARTLSQSNISVRILRFM
jgi:hypothetical protein